MIVEVVAADVGEGRDIELAGADALLHERVRRGLDHRALSARLDHAAQPRLHLGRFRGGLPADVVNLVAADFERNRAHRARHDAAGLENVL